MYIYIWTRNDQYHLYVQNGFHAFLPSGICNSCTSLQHDPSCKITSLDSKFPSKCPKKEFTREKTCTKRDQKIFLYKPKIHTFCRRNPQGVIYIYIFTNYYVTMYLNAPPPPWREPPFGKSPLASRGCSSRERSSLQPAKQLVSKCLSYLFWTGLAACWGWHNKRLTAPQYDKRPQQHGWPDPYRQ